MDFPSPCQAINKTKGSLRSKVAADYFKVPVNTTYRLAAAKKIPGFKVGERGAFLKRKSIIGYTGRLRVVRRMTRLPALGSRNDD